MSFIHVLSSEMLSNITMAQVGVKQSWGFKEFVEMVRAKGSFKRADGQVNKTTGEVFDTYVAVDFPTSGTNTFVGFSSNLGELSDQQVASQIKDLQVVELESGSFKICKKGTNSWKDVELF